MTALNTFIEANIPVEFRHTRDYAGPRGWIALVNRFLKKLETKGLFELGLQKEIAVEVDDRYWITIPSDCRKVLGIYYPPVIEYSQKDARYRYEFTNGKIKLWTPFDKNPAPDTFTLSSGSATQVSINDTDATADVWKDYLLKLTNGTYSGRGILIGSNAAADAGVSVLTFRHTFDGTVNSTAGYLTKEYLMLSYKAVYTPIADYDDEIPIDEDFQFLMTNWLCKEAISADDKRRRVYQADFKEDLESLEEEWFTPTEEQARPRPRSLAGLEDCENYDNTELRFIGED